MNRLSSWMRREVKVSRTCFVHMPKCGGTSVRLALEQLLGSNSLRFDYEGLPGDSEVSRYKHVLTYLRHPFPLGSQCCVYGHFRPLKYLGDLQQTSDIRLVTILREPVDRLISHYRYLIALDDPSNAMRQDLKDHDDDFVWFAMHPRLRNLYSRHLYQVPLSRINFIGIYERLNQSWHSIAELITNRKHSGLSLPASNRTDDRANAKIPFPVISPTTLSEIEDIHAEDIALYDFAKMRMDSALL